MADDDLAALAWRKSSASFAGNCVMVTSHQRRVMVRDSADVGNLTLVFSLRDWDAFVVRVRENVFNASRRTCL